MTDGIYVREENKILHIVLDSPSRGNSLTHNMAIQIEKAVLSGQKKASVELIYLSGNGNNFCTGANLAWMRNAIGMKPAQNFKDMSALAKMYKAILSLDKPLITRVHGKIIGGGVGLVAASDIVVCDTNATFCLSETKWGLIPGIISPLLIRKIGYGRFCDLALSGRTYSASEAFSDQLVSMVCEPAEILKKTDQIIELTKKNSLAANQKLKQLLKKMYPLSSKTIDVFCKASADMRKSPDFAKRSEAYAAKQNEVV